MYRIIGVVILVVAFGFLADALRAQDCDSLPDFDMLQPYPTAGWNQFDLSTAGIGANGQVRFRVNELSGNNNIILGLNSDPAASASYQDMEFAIYMQMVGETTSRIQIYEQGKYIGILLDKPQYGELILGIQRSAGVVEYLVNDVVRFTSENTSEDSLFFDHSFLKKDSLSKFVASEIEVCELATPQKTEQDCEELAIADYPQPYSKMGWNQFDVSQDKGIAGDGEICFEIDSYDYVNNFVVGLDNDPVSGEIYTEIDYAVFMRTGVLNIISIYENGLFKKHLINTAESVAGTRFCIRRKNGVITYLVDGVVKFTSDTTSTKHLFYDNSATRRNNQSSFKLKDLVLCSSSPKE